MKEERYVKLNVVETTEGVWDAEVETNLSRTEYISILRKVILAKGESLVLMERRTEERRKD